MAFLCAHNWIFLCTQEYIKKFCVHKSTTTHAQEYIMECCVHKISILILFWKLWKHSLSVLDIIKYTLTAVSCDNYQPERISGTTVEFFLVAVIQKVSLLFTGVELNELTTIDQYTINHCECCCLVIVSQGGVFLLVYLRNTFALMLNRLHKKMSAVT